MSHDIMIDLETLGTTADAAILSIGAVAFDLDAGTLCVDPAATFYCVLNIDSQPGRKITSSTLAWWMGQPPAAQAVFNEDGEHIRSVLYALGNWIVSKGEGAQVWSNGADFDLPMLAHAYASQEVPLPWAPYAARCYRTYKNLPGARAVKVEREGHHHNALYDAIYQATHLCAIHKALFTKEQGVMA